VRLTASLALAVASAIVAPTLLGVRSEPVSERQFDGFNVIASRDYPFGGMSAIRALTNAKGLGARTVAIVPFMWQSDPTSPLIVRGKDMTDAELRFAIRDAHALGLAVLVKPHIWVPQNWAGTVAMDSEETWTTWFANYRRELERITRIAEEERAEAIAIGTELDATTQRTEWNALIGAARSLFSGRLLYVAHNIEGVEKVPFWDRLDLIGVTLYPPLGSDDDRAFRLIAMSAVADQLDSLASRTGKQIVVAEIGLRSAEGAAAKPWESPEERDAAPDPQLQADVLSDWLAALHRPTIKGVLIWYWLTDPHAGGSTDTDFTVQGKLAEHVLKCAWAQNCGASKAGHLQ
jgi:hypothetical protein